MNKIFLAAMFALAACNTTSDAPPLANARIGGPFSLADQYGRTVTDRNLGALYRVMYFGYTSCPDVCPTDVANLARGVQQFRKSKPDQASKIRLIFVSVDPARDTPSVLRAFAANFDPNMIALTGPPSAIAEMAKAYGVAFSIAPGQDKSSYVVDHSRVAYLMSPANTPVALLPQEGTPAAIAAELEKWVR